MKIRLSETKLGRAYIVLRVRLLQMPGLDLYLVKRKHIFKNPLSGILK